MNAEEFVSEVYIAFLAGMQDKKKSIDDFYDDYDEAFAKQSTIEKRFREAVDDITDCVGDALKTSVFRRPPILYSLFCVIYHRRHGLPGATLATTKSALSNDARLSLREAVESLSEKVETFRAGDEIPRRYESFVKACLQQTDNIKPRQTRFRELYHAAFD